MPLLAVDLVVAGLFIHSAVGLIVCVVVGGLLLGILNTVLTECVMSATDLPRPVASSAYSGVRFLGGAIAPPAATWLAGSITPSTPFFAGAASVLVAAAIVIIGRKHLWRSDVEEESQAEEAEVLTLADAD
jgi:MFS family permease